MVYYSNPLPSYYLEVCDNMSFRKYYLVEPDTYNELVRSSNSKADSLQHPNVKAFKEIDSKIDTILNKQSTSETEKLDEYNSNIDSYKRNFRNAIGKSRKDALFGDPTPQETNSFNLQPLGQTKSISPAAFSTSTPVATPKSELFEPDENKKKIFDDTMKTIPHSYHSSANKLAKFIDSSKDFSIASSGRLKYKGKAINDSDAGALFKSAVTYRHIFGKHKQAVQNFLTALTESGFPTKSLPYTRMLSALEKKSIASKKSLMPKWQGKERKLKRITAKPLEWEKFDS